MKNKLRAFFYAFHNFLFGALFFIISLFIIIMYMKIFSMIAGYSFVALGIQSDKAISILLCSGILGCFTVYGLCRLEFYIRDRWRDYKDKLKELNDE